MLMERNCGILNLLSETNTSSPSILFLFSYYLSNLQRHCYFHRYYVRSCKVKNKYSDEHHLFLANNSSNRLNYYLIFLNFPLTRGSIINSNRIFDLFATEVLFINPIIESVEKKKTKSSVMRQIIRIVNISAPNFTLILNELKLNQSRRRFRILGLAPSSNN